MILAIAVSFCIGNINGHFLVCDSHSSSIGHVTVCSREIGTVPRIAGHAGTEFDSIRFNKSAMVEDRQFVTAWRAWSGRCYLHGNCAGQPRPPCAQLQA